MMNSDACARAPEPPCRPTTRSLHTLPPETGPRLIPLRTTSLIFSLCALSCGGNVSTENYKTALCQQAHAHDATCPITLSSDLVDCRIASDDAICTWNCDLNTSCDGLTGQNRSEYLDYIACDMSCTCESAKTFMPQCGIDPEGIDCSRARQCNCAYTRTCDGALAFKQCMQCR